VEDLVPPAFALAFEVLPVFEHETQVDLVLVGAPPTRPELLTVGLQAQLLNLVELGLEALRVRTAAGLTRTPQHLQAPTDTCTFSH
jgi:hypothetical protein